MSDGVCAPQGFVANGVSSGMKRRLFAPGVPPLDLALVASRAPCVAVGVTTTNRIVSPSVVLIRERLRTGQARAVVVNAGNANCLVGPQGYRDIQVLTQAVAKTLGVPAGSVLPMSTGVIGRRLIVPKLVEAVPALVHGLSRQGHHAAAAAILTTDTKLKESAAQVTIGGRPVAVGGMAKGSGMVAPSMATMLAVFTTDAAVPRGWLRWALADANRQTFNRVTVDGDTSTNDAAVILANGEAGVTIRRPQERALFHRALVEVSSTLARMIVRDGEGATRLIEVCVCGASTVRAAEQVAKCVAHSPLVKTMVAGADPNVGRIAAAVGRAGVRIQPARLAIWINDVPALRRERVLIESRARLREALRHPVVTLCVELGMGSAHATVWTCDLTEGYVRINARYTT